MNNGDLPNFPVRIGGLFRCCVQLGHNSDPAVAARVQCPSCHDWLIWRDGAWEWDHTPMAGPS